jgi:adenine-specific DNA-methyltransferase
VVAENCEDVGSIADIFAGTGAVASAFTDKRIITNDNLLQQLHLPLGLVQPTALFPKKIKDLIVLYNELI